MSQVGNDNYTKRPKSVKTNKNVSFGDIRYFHPRKYFFIVTDPNVKEDYCVEIFILSGSNPGKNFLMKPAIENSSWLVFGSSNYDDC